MNASSQSMLPWAVPGSSQLQPTRAETRALLVSFLSTKSVRELVPFSTFCRIRTVPNPSDYETGQANKEKQDHRGADQPTDIPAHIGVGPGYGGFRSGLSGSHWDGVLYRTYCRCNRDFGLGGSRLRHECLGRRAARDLLLFSPPIPLSFALGHGTVPLPLFSVE